MRKKLLMELINLQLRRAHWREAAAVDRAWAVLLEGGLVGGGAVAFVLGEIVFGPLFVMLAHEAVAGDLGEDAGGGDGETFAVALDDGGLRRGERGHGAAVHQRVRGRRGKLSEDGVHRAMGGLEDVDVVDDPGVDDADAEMNFRLRMNGGEEFLADFLGELLGVIEASKGFGEAIGNPLRRQHRRRRHNRPGKRAAPGFINAR